MTLELRRIIAMNVSNRRRRFEKRAAEPAVPSFSDDQIQTIMALAGTLPVEKRDVLLQRLVAHLQDLGVARPTD